MPLASLLRTFQPRNAAYHAASRSASVTFIEKWSMRTVFQPVEANGAFIGVLLQAAVVSPARPAHCPCAKARLSDPENGTAAAAKPRVLRIWRREIRPRS